MAEFAKGFESKVGFTGSVNKADVNFKRDQIYRQTSFTCEMEIMFTSPELPRRDVMITCFPDTSKNNNTSSSKDTDIVVNMCDKQDLRL